MNNEDKRAERIEPKLGDPIRARKPSLPKNDILSDSERSRIRSERLEIYREAGQYTRGDLPNLAKEARLQWAYWQLATNAGPYKFTIFCIPTCLRKTISAQFYTDESSASDAPLMQSATVLCRWFLHLEGGATTLDLGNGKLSLAMAEGENAFAQNRVGEMHLRPDDAGEQMCIYAYLRHPNWLEVYKAIEEYLTNAEPNGGRRLRLVPEFHKAVLGHSILDGATDVVVVGLAIEAELRSIPIGKSAPDSA